MTSETSEYEVPPTPAAGHEVPASRRWSGPDLVIGSAVVVLLISLFLPWFSGWPGQRPSRSTVTGPGAHGYLWVVFTLAICALVVLIGSESINRLPGNLPSTEQMMVGATGLALLLTLLGLLMKPAGLAAASWSYGGFIAVLAAAAATLAASGASGPLHLPRRPARAAKTGG